MVKRKRPSGMTDLEYRVAVYHEKKKQSHEFSKRHRTETEDFNVDSSSSDSDSSQLSRDSSQLSRDSYSGDSSSGDSSSGDSSSSDIPSLANLDLTLKTPDTGGFSLKDKVKHYVKDYSLSQHQAGGLLSLLKSCSSLSALDLTNLPKTGRTLLGHRQKDAWVLPESSQFLYYGVEACLLQMVAMLENPVIPHTIEIVINADGLPLFASSHSLTPVLISTNLHPFLVGIVSVYHVHRAAEQGLEKGEKATLYLSRFIDEINNLKTFKGANVVIKFATLDLVGLAEVKGIKGHGSTHGCPRCTVIGVSEKNRMTFTNVKNGGPNIVNGPGGPTIPNVPPGGPTIANVPTTQPIPIQVTKRTDASFRNRTDRMHHNVTRATEFESTYFIILYHFVAKSYHFVAKFYHFVANKS